jgi:putative redox protein
MKVSDNGPGYRARCDVKGVPNVSTDNVRVRWAGNRQFVAWDEGGHGIVMDSPARYKGEGTGARPLEVFLEALAACTAMDVVSILEKKRQDFSSLEIEVTGVQREDEYPKIYTDIELLYVVTGRAVKPDAVARAIELSEEKYCSIRGMLGPQVNVVTGYRVEEEAAATKKSDEGKD